MSKRAIILAGGKGTRLKPYTIAMPKPLVPIVDKPILEIIIRQLKNNRFNHITITINHLSELIKAFFGDGSKWGVKIDYSIEEKPLSTMGPLTLINNLPKNFLVMNGDVLTDLNFENFFNYHCNNNNIFTISSFIREQKSEYGILQVDDHKNLSNFHEKPITKYEVSMGVYAVNKEVIKKIPYNKPYGFDQLMLKLIKDKQSARVKRHDGYWLDIGRPDDYEKACKDFNIIFKNRK